MSSKQSNYKKIFFTYNGIGDAIMLSALAENFYNLKKEKLLITTQYKFLFENNPNVEIIDFGYNLFFYPEKVLKVNKELLAKNLKLIFLEYWAQRIRNNRKHLAYGDKHIIAELCEKAGLSGNVNIKPKVYLKDEEKQYGRFFENQIVVMSQGSAKNKIFDYKKMQNIVNQLKHKYDFVQIGRKKDILLDGVLDKRGVLTFRQIASVLYNSDLFVGEVGGFMHLARAVDCRAVIAFTGAEPLYFASYSCNENILPDKDCDLCRKNEIQTLDNREVCPNEYTCVNSISIYKMIQGIENQMARKKNNEKLEIDTFEVNSIDIDGIKEYFESVEVSLTLNNKFQIFLFGFLPIVKIKNFAEKKTKIYLMGIPVLKVKRFEFMKFKFKIEKIYIFNIIPFLKIIRNEKENIDSIYFLQFIKVLKYF
jgi:hypothetical protein